MSASAHELSRRQYEVLEQLRDPPNIRPYVAAAASVLLVAYAFGRLHRRL